MRTRSPQARPRAAVLAAAVVGVVCAVVTGPTRTAHAQGARRPVAVIDLAYTPTAEKLAKDLDRELNGHPDLSQLPDSTLSAELIGPPADDDARLLGDATRSLTNALDHVAKFEFALAGVNATEGETALLDVTPSLAVPVLADLSFVLGRIRLGESKPEESREAFELAQRLGPGRVLDPAQYLPEEIAAFEAAKVVTTGTATLSVKGSGTLWIDGKELGPAGSPVEIVPGLHVVWLTGAERETRGRIVHVAAGSAQAVAIEDAVASDRLKVRRARIALRAAPDITAESSALARLAGLLGVHDAVLIWVLANGQLATQTWRDRAPGFSARRAVKAATAQELLAPLAPPRKPADPGSFGGGTPKLPPEPPTVWYRRHWVWAAGVGALVALVGSLVYVDSIDHDTSASIGTILP